MPRDQHHRCLGAYQRSAFTLVELLVLLLAGFILVCLVCPAIGRARTSANQEGCKANQMALAKGLRQYHDTHQRFPAGVTVGMNQKTGAGWWGGGKTPKKPAFDPPPGGWKDDKSSYPADGYWGWQVRIASFIGEEELAKSITGPAQWPWWSHLRDKPKTGENTLVGVLSTVLICPAEGRKNPAWIEKETGNRQALTSYPGVTGRDSYREDLPGEGFPTGKGAKLPGQDGILFVNSAVRLQDITDGASNTLLIGERPVNDSSEYGWAWVGWGYDGFGFGAADGLLGVRERVPTMLTGPSLYRPGKPGDLTHWNHYWSLHPGGALWAMADGSVRQIGYEAGQRVTGTEKGVFYTLLEALASRSSKDSMEPFGNPNQQPLDFGKEKPPKRADPFKK